MRSFCYRYLYGFYDKEEFSILANEKLMEAARLVKESLKAGKKMEEPDYTASIVVKFPALMSYYWSGAQFGGCFIHQRPYVHFERNGKIEGCEIGDLLVLCKKAVSGKASYNAALLQLKIAHAPLGKIMKPDNMAQYVLYTEWPKFSFGKKYSAIASFDVLPKVATLGAQYMFVNEYTCCLYTHATPKGIMINDVNFDFGTFLYDFIHWQNGRPICGENEPNMDDWSKAIWEIVARTRNTIFKRTNANITNEARQKGDFFHFITSRECLNYDVLPEKYEEEKSINREEEFAGISILFIDLDRER